jgi:hypothetical protein
MIQATRAGEWEFALKAMPRTASKPAPEVASAAAEQQPADLYDDSNVIVLYPGKNTARSVDNPSRPQRDECVPYIVRQSR